MKIDYQVDPIFSHNTFIYDKITKEVLFSCESANNAAFFTGVYNDKVRKAKRGIEPHSTWFDYADPKCGLVPHVREKKKVFAVRRNVLVLAASVDDITRLMPIDYETFYRNVNCGRECMCHGRWRAKFIDQKVAKLMDSHYMIRLTPKGHKG